ncbi:MAG TPA: carbohydrate kinase [Candidatus Atribacteria bacterium]|nr:carbohydrate kinase [Candidatus Atribacteria bacterium]HPT78647.1 carbohydrate kinase [Candidatus Atribacteria bacterium]
MSFKLLAYGEVLWDIIDDREYIGGAPFNVAAHAVRLGCTGAVVTRVGADERGIRAIETIESFGVDTSFVQTDIEHPTGTACVALDAEGVPAFTLPLNVAYDFIKLYDDDLEKIERAGFDALCFGTLVQRSRSSADSLYRLLKSVRFKLIFYDVNIRLGFLPKEIIRESLQHSTIVKLNGDEARLLSDLLFGKAYDEEAFMQRIADEFWIDVVIITKGGDGCVVFDGKRAERCPQSPVAVADTVGAGDAFSAAFLTAYAKGADPFESARLGNILGGYVASKSGAVPEYTDELKEKLGILR